MSKFWERLDGHKTKLGNTLLIVASQLLPGKLQATLFALGSALTGVGVLDALKKIIVGK